MLRIYPIRLCAAANNPALLGTRVTFFRHGETTNNVLHWRLRTAIEDKDEVKRRFELARTPDPSLSDRGYDQVSVSAERFVHDYPDVSLILCSYMKRAMMTAATLQEAYRKTLGRSVVVRLEKDLHENCGLYVRNITEATTVMADGQPLDRRDVAQWEHRSVPLPQDWYDAHTEEHGLPGLTSAEALQEYPAFTAREELPNGWWGAKSRETRIQAQERAERAWGLLYDQAGCRFSIDTPPDATQHALVITHGRFFSYMASGARVHRLTDEPLDPNLSVLYNAAVTQFLFSPNSEKMISSSPLVDLSNRPLATQRQRFRVRLLLHNCTKHLREAGISTVASAAKPHAWVLPQDVAGGGASSSDNNEETATPTQDTTYSSTTPLEAKVTIDTAPPTAKTSSSAHPTGQHEEQQAQKEKEEKKKPYSIGGTHRRHRVRITFVRHAESHNNTFRAKLKSEFANNPEGLKLHFEEGRSPDPQLTPRGLEQVHIAARRLTQDIPSVDLVLCSYLERALQTALVIQQEYGATHGYLPVVRVERDVHETSGLYVTKVLRTETADSTTTSFDQVGLPGMTSQQVIAEHPSFTVGKQLCPNGWWAGRAKETARESQHRAVHVWRQLLQEAARIVHEQESQRDDDYDNYHHKDESHVLVVTHGHFFSFLMAAASATELTEPVIPPEMAVLNNTALTQFLFTPIDDEECNEEEDKSKSKGIIGVSASELRYPSSLTGAAQRRLAERNKRKQLQSNKKGSINNNGSNDVALTGGESPKTMAGQVEAVLATVEAPDGVAVPSVETFDAMPSPRAHRGRQKFRVELVFHNDSKHLEGLDLGFVPSSAQPKKWITRRTSDDKDGDDGMLFS